MSDLIDLISKGEGLSVEFKETLPSESMRWLKTIVAFANGCGGTLLVGVNNQGEIIGIPGYSSSQVLDSMTSPVCDLCYPMIPWRIPFQRSMSADVSSLS